MHVRFAHAALDPVQEQAAAAAVARLFYSICAIDSRVLTQKIRVLNAVRRKLPNGDLYSLGFISSAVGRLKGGVESLLACRVRAEKVQKTSKQASHLHHNLDKSSIDGSLVKA